MPHPALRKTAAALAAIFACVLAASCASSRPAQIAAASCQTPPEASCGPDGCDRALLANLGNAIEPKTGRKFFLDYPCDLKRNEKVVFILNLHGAGSIANWERHYFPAVDFKERYRLVIATPSAATAEPLRMWRTDADDEYLHNIVDLVESQFGKNNIRSFWLAGHSQGGGTAHRLVCSDFFKRRVDGLLSLSGGRIGQAAIHPDFFVGARQAPGLPRPGVRTEAAALPTCDFSFIFTSGEKEIVALPETSPWAEKYGCAARVRRPDIVDTRKGHVTGAAPGRPAAWGREARPGMAQEFIYPGCASGRVVADVLRLDKGHSEGLEPNVTERLIELIVSAPGGTWRSGA